MNNQAGSITLAGANQPGTMYPQDPAHAGNFYQVPWHSDGTFGLAPGYQVQGFIRRIHSTTGPTGASTVGMPDIPASAQQWEALAIQAATHFSLPLVYFARQINQESGFHSTDAQGHVLTSSAGAEGIAQFKPSTAATIPHCVTNLANPPDNCLASASDKSMGIDPTNPAEALPAGAYLMKQYLNQYVGGNSFTVAYAKALAAYYAGKDAVDGAVNRCGNKWLSCMADEPQHYVQVIMGGDYANP